MCLVSKIPWGEGGGEEGEEDDDTCSPKLENLLTKYAMCNVNYLQSETKLYLVYEYVCTVYTLYTVYSAADLS